VTDPTPKQMQLLRELDFFGGALIVRSRMDAHEYVHLQNAGLVTCFTMYLNEVRYEITEAGRAVLRSTVD
jgi:hypothetical protein